MAAFSLPDRNLIQPPFSAASISCKRVVYFCSKIWHYHAILQACFPKKRDILSIKIYFLVVVTHFLLNVMCRNISNSTSGPKSDTNIFSLTFWQHFWQFLAVMFLKIPPNPHEIMLCIVFLCQMCSALKRGRQWLCNLAIKRWQFKTTGKMDILILASSLWQQP